MDALASLYNTLAPVQTNELEIGADELIESGALITDYLESKGLSCSTQIFERENAYPLLMVVTDGGKAEEARQLMGESPCSCRTFPGIDIQSVISVVRDLDQGQEGLVFKCAHSLLRDFADCLRDTAVNCIAPAPRLS